MSNIYNTPSDYDPNDPERMRIDRVEEVTDEDQDKLENIQFPSRAEIMLSLSLFELLFNRVDAFLEDDAEEEEVELDDIQLVLAQLHTQLLKLKVENISSDYRFAQSLSEAWHALKLHQSELSTLRRAPDYFKSLQIFIKQVTKYPKNADHSLGYYLTEYAGEKWLPFPFIDLLSGLHEEFILKKSKSTLSDWTLSLQTILSTEFDEEQ